MGAKNNGCIVILQLDRIWEIKGGESESDQICEPQRSKK